MLHDPEARKDLRDEFEWLREVTRMALVALGKAREVLEAVEEDRILGGRFTREAREGHRLPKELLAEAVTRLRPAEGKAR